MAPQQGYDEPGIVSYAIRPFCPTSADGLQSELLDELERVRDRQEKIIALLRKSSLRPDVRFTLDDAIKQAEHDLDEYNALLTRYGRSGNAARP